MNKYLLAFFILFFFTINLSIAQLQFINYPQPDGKVCDIELDIPNNIGYISGSFDNVNGQPRSRIAAFNISTGALLNWKPSTNEQIGVVYEKMIVTDSMIVCLFSSNPGKIIFINRTNGSKRTVYAPASAGIVTDIIVKDSLLFAVGDLDVQSGVRELALFNINQQTSYPYSWEITSITTDNHISAFTFFSDIEFLNDTMYLMGRFNKVNGVNRNNLAAYKFAYNTISENYTFTLLSTNLPLSANIGNISNYPFATSLFERQGNNLLLVSRAYQNATGYYERIINFNRATNSVIESTNDSIGIPLTYYDINFDRDGLITKSAPNSFLKVGHYSNRYGNEVRWLQPYGHSIIQNSIITSAGQKSTLGTARDLSYITTLKKMGDYVIVGGFFDTLNNNYVKKNLACMCLAPKLPRLFTVSKKAVCTSEKGVSYAFSQQNKSVSISSYIWTYSGTGVTMQLNDTSALLDFSATATSGFLKVKAISSCGSYSDSLMIYITVYSPPKNTITSPLSSIINCYQPIATLVGSSISLGNMTIMQWRKPDNTVNAGTTLPTTIPGSYIFETNSIFYNPLYSCTDKDTLILSIDTVHPTITQPTTIPTITCYVPSIQLTAQTINSSDSIAWQKGAGVYLANPISVTSSSAYNLIALDTTNGCSTTKAIQINDNLVVPKLNIANTNDTLTCRKDSAILSGSSTSAHTILYWTHNNINIGNNATIHQADIYVFNVIDTVNGCKALMPFYLPEYKSPPQIGLLSRNAEITCSYNTTPLYAEIQTPNTTATWQGPNNFTATNPTQTTQLGTYYVTAIRQDNGCTAKDSIIVNYTPILDVKIFNDTTVCKGSDVNLYSSLVKGAATNLSYSWNNNLYTDSNITVTPTATTVYKLTITSSNGCYGTDSLTITIPSDIITTASTFKWCIVGDNGLIQVNSTGGIAPYVYSLDGLHFQNNQEFDSLALGNYTISTRDSLGCSSTIQTNITSTTQLPTPKFLVKTFSQIGDSITLVDVSNPKPDSIQWVFPSSIKTINTTRNTATITCSDSGRYIIGILAYYGGCNTLISKEIFFGLKDTTLATNKPHNGIESINISPNPTTGIFDMQIRFYKKQSFTATISDLTGRILYTRPVLNENILYVERIDFSSVANGTYLLKVITPYDAQQQLIILSR